MFHCIKMFSILIILIHIAAIVAQRRVSFMTDHLGSVVLWLIFICYMKSTDKKWLENILGIMTSQNVTLLFLMTSWHGILALCVRNPPMLSLHKGPTMQSFEDFVVSKLLWNY